MITPREKIETIKIAKLSKIFLKQPLVLAFFGASVSFAEFSVRIVGGRLECRLGG